MRFFAANREAPSDESAAQPIVAPPLEEDLPRRLFEDGLSSHLNRQLNNFDFQGRLFHASTRLRARLCSEAALAAMHRRVQPTGLTASALKR